MKTFRYILLIFTFISTQVNGQINHKHYLLMGRIDLSKEQYSDAIRDLNMAIGAKPNDFEGYFLRGIAKFSLSDYQGAVEDFTKTLEIHPLYVRAFHYRGLANDRLGNYADAQADFNKAVSLDPFSVDLHLAAGATKMHLNNFEGAIADFDTALLISPDNSEAYVNRGVAKRFVNQLDGALNDLNKAVEYDFFNVEAIVRRGMIYIEREEYGNAMIDFNEALKMEKDNPLVYFNRAVAYLNLGDTIAALHDYETVNILDQRNALTYYNRAIIYSLLKEYDIALALYNKVVEINPDNIYGYFNRGILFYMTKDYESAEDDFTTVLTLFPDFIDAWINRSVTRFEKGDIDGAEKDRYKAMEIMNIVNENESNRDSLYQAYSKSINYNKIINFESDFINGERSGKLAQFSNIDIRPFGNFIATVIDIEKYKKGERRKNYFIDAELSNINEKSGLNGYLAYTINQMYSEKYQSMLNDSIISAIENETLKTLLQGILNYEIFNYQHAEKAFQTIADDRVYGKYATLNLGSLQCDRAELALSSQSYDNQVFITQKKSSGINARPAERPDYGIALQTIEQMVRQNKKNAFAWYNLGNLHLQMQEFNKAIDDYSKALECEPSLAEAYYNRGLTLLFLGEKKLANKDLGKAGELGLDEAYAVMKRFF